MAIKFILIVSVLISLSSLSSCDRYKYKKYYLDQYPSSSNFTLTADDTIILKATKSKHPPKGSYSVSIKASTNSTYSYVITFVEFKLRRSGDKCMDKLTVSKTEDNRETTLYQGCSESNFPRTSAQEPKTFDRITFNIEFTSNSKSFKELEITLSRFRKCQATKETSEFACQNDRCIDRNLVCDGRDNCGDASDENYTVCHGGVRKFKLGMSMGLLGFIIICGVVGYMCFRRRRNQPGSVFTQPQAQSYPTTYANYSTETTPAFYPQGQDNQGYPGTQQPYPGTQPYPGAQQPYPGAQQPYPGTQPYPGAQQPYPGTQQPYPGAPAAYQVQYQGSYPTQAPPFQGQNQGYSEVPPPYPPGKDTPKY